MNPKITNRLGYLCLGAMILYGVQAHSQTMNEAIHASYSGFDSTQLSTDFLLDRSMNVTRLEEAAIEIDSTANSTRNWLQSYMDLRSCQYNSAFPLSPKQLFQFIDEYRKNDLHPIGLIAKKVNSIPENSFEDGSIAYDSVTAKFDFSYFNYDLDEQLVVVAGAMVPLVKGESINLIFGQDFMFADIPIDSMFVSIPALNHNEKIVINHVHSIPLADLSSEIRDITVHVEFYSHSRRYQRGIYFVLDRLPPTFNFPHEFIFDFTIPNPCIFNAPKGYGDAMVFVVYSDQTKKNNQTITKPLILVEGYDPSSMDYGAIQWNTFSKGRSYNEFGEEVYQQLRLMPQLLDKLTGLGYDLLIVNFKTSSNHLENNAAILAKIIQWAKFKTQGNEDVTLMGASMGGMVSQTAMNLLDKSGCNTCVGTFVSFDAPYHGANIPMGIQEAAKFFYENLVEAVIQYEFKLNVPAAKELLYQHVNANTERQDWLNTFNQMNKKLAAFNICLASSSHESISNNIKDGDQLISWEIYSPTLRKKVLYVNLYSANRPDKLVLTAKVPTVQYFGIPIYFATHNAHHWPLSYNYDGRPGSLSNFIGEMYEQFVEADAKIKNQSVIKTGPLMPNGAFHTFVPTISAIDHIGTNPAVKINVDDLKIPNQLTPFDFVHFSSQNDFHVLISKEQIDNLINTLSQGISSYNHLTTLPIGSNSKFNCGKSLFSVFGSFVVQNGGIFSFNNYSLTNFGIAGIDEYPKTQKIYARTSNCDAFVRCETNGAIILGGTKPTGEQLMAEVEFRKGSVLDLQPDAILRIRDGSALIIDEGALLMIHPGAQIILEGENAVLEIRGTVRLENNAVFSFTKGTASKGGFVRFNFKDNTNSHFLMTGPYGKINLTGEAHFQDKIVEIVGNTRLWLPSSNIPGGEEFKLKDGLVEYTGGGTIDVACSTHIENVDFEQIEGQQGIGLTTHGQASLFIEDCVFKYFNTGIKAVNNDMGSDFNIKNNIFFQCSRGLETYGRKITLDGNGFNSCYIGLLVNGTDDVVMQGTDLIYNFIGVETKGNNPHVRVDGCWFLRNEYGIHDVNETRFTLSCSPFEQNSYAVSTNGKVNMSPTYMFPGYTQGGSFNTFYENHTSFELTLGEIHLKNGQNNFIAGSSGQLPNFFVGSLISNPTYIPNNILDVSGNYFDNIPSGGISTGHGTMYSLLSYGVSGGLVLLNGALLNSFDQTCYSVARIFPDFKGEVLVDAEEYNHGGYARLAELKAYPNPTDDVIMLEGKTEASSKRMVILYDLNGKEIHRREWILVPGLNRTQLSLRELAEPGVYLIKIIDDSGDYQVVRISLTY